MKKVLLVLAMSTLSYPLQAPYLISATALSDSSVQLAWRNNDVATTGFIIQRKDSTEAGFMMIDSIKSATTASYVDIKNLRPQTLYSYQMLAYSAEAVSIASNTQQAITQEIVEVFKKPAIQVYWNFDTSKSMQIKLFDSSNCEAGYIIYRDEGFTGTFNVIKQIESVDPFKKDSIVWFDSAVTINTWYKYKVAAYRSDDTIFSEVCSTYTYREPPNERVIKFRKISEFPISLAKSKWSAKIGDSIIIKENPPAPQEGYSVINVKDPENPKFDGYIDSVHLLSYPQSTLIPAFLNYGVSNVTGNISILNYGDNIFLIKDSLLYMFKISNNNLVKIDSLYRSGNAGCILPAFNENKIIVQNRFHSEYGDSNIVQTVSFADSGMTRVSKYTIEPNRDHDIRGNKQRINCDLIDGALNNKLYFHQYQYFYQSEQFVRYLQIIHCADSSLPDIKFIADSTEDDSTVYFWNSSVCLSEVDYLCIRKYVSKYAGGIPPETYYKYNLFVASILNPRPWKDACRNSALFTFADTQQITNVFLDSLNKNIFVISPLYLTILGYYDTTSVTIKPSKSNKNVLSYRHPAVITNPYSHGATIILHSTIHPSDLYFYDLSGRQIDKMRNVTSNAVLWRPKTRSIGCYFVVVKSGGERYVKKFIVR